jgi:hypothetical protein
MEISKDEQECARFRSRRMAETDRISNLLTVEERGRTRGRAEGMALGEARGIALGRTRGMDEVLALMDKGLSTADIKKILGR